MEAYFSTFHEGSILFNKPSFYPPATEYLRWELRNFPDDTSTTILQALGVRAAVIHPKRWTNARRRRRLMRRLERRSDDLPLVKKFPDRPDDADWTRYHLGGEQLHTVRPLEGEGVPRECLCDELDRADYELRSRRGLDPSLAKDGDRSSRWTTRRGQMKGDFLEIVFDRPRRPVRIEIEMSYPYEEFARNLEFIGRRGEERFKISRVDDVWYKVGLIRQLVEDPKKARLRYDLEPSTVDTLRLYIARTEAGSQAWSVPEIHIYELVASAAAAY